MSSLVCTSRAGVGRVCLLAAVVAGLCVAMPVTGRAQGGVVTDADQFMAAYNGAMTAFNAGNWAAAATGFEAAMKMLIDDKAPQLPPLLYMTGAAYFNAGEHVKAVEAFKKYLAKFPNAEKAMEVKLGMARAQLKAKNFDEAAKLFQQFESIPALHDEAMSSQVQAYKEGGKPDQAIGVLERLIAPDIKTPSQADGAITLAEMYAEKKDSPKAIALLQKLDAKTGIIENLVALNAVAVKIGDESLENKQYKEALGAYRLVRSREEVLKFQKNRVSGVEARMEANLKATVGNPQLMAQVQMMNTQLKETAEAAKKLFEEFEKLPDFGPALLMRMARAFYDWEKRWESIVVYERLLTRYPEAKERESALFGQIISYAEVNQAKHCQKLCEHYLKEFPNGPNAGTVGYLSGAVALQAQDFAGAETFFGVMIEKVPNSEYKQDMRFLLGNAKFMQGKFAEALKDYNRYVADYPNGKDIEEANYRIALCAVFTGEYEKAMGLLSAYLEKYPQGQLASDGRYRLMVCKYAASLYAEVLKDGEAWLRDYPKNQQEGEVEALIGDSYAAENKLEEAVAAYQRSYKTATTDEVLNYSLFEASKHLQKLGKWTEVSRMFEEFVRAKPDHTAVVSAMFWIGKARSKEGKTEEAKAFMVENLKKYIGDPKREAVELLLQQLAQLCAKRPRAVTPPAAPGAAAPAPEPPAATPPPYDAYAELAKQLAPLDDSTNVTTKARLLYAKAELAKLIKKLDDSDKIYQEMTDRFKPEDLSPVILAQLGDFLLFRGDMDKAAGIFEKLKEDFPKSDYLDYAYVGLGEVALSKKQNDKALELFTDALDKIGATSKLKEATIGKAKTLYELKQYPEAKKLFEQVASVREWRGESTAFAVFSLAEIEAQQGRYAEAIALYRRVFVAYQKYLPWVAKSYIRAADSFDKMGKRQDAIDNLKEMLRNEKLVKFPETEAARKRLQEWGVAV
jgi:TolA-binding protein